eukprot:4651126-Pyramimonas_sp.AAC.1
MGRPRDNYGSHGTTAAGQPRAVGPLLEIKETFAPISPHDARACARARHEHETEADFRAGSP